MTPPGVIDTSTATWFCACPVRHSIANKTRRLFDSPVLHHGVPGWAVQSHDYAELRVHAMQVLDARHLHTTTQCVTQQQTKTIPGTMCRTRGVMWCDFISLDVRVYASSVRLSYKLYTKQEVPKKNAQHSSVPSRKFTPPSRIFPPTVPRRPVRPTNAFH